VVHDDSSRGAHIDYRAVPPRRCEAWPEVRSNARGFSRFIYNDMIDYLRRVSSRVLIGRATRRGRESDNYFILCRE
jgi:hypothetical protein